MNRPSSKRSVEGLSSGSEKNTHHFNNYTSNQRLYKGYCKHLQKVKQHA